MEKITTVIIFNEDGGFLPNKTSTDYKFVCKEFKLLTAYVLFIDELSMSSSIKCYLTCSFCVQTTISRMISKLRKVRKLFIRKLKTDNILKRSVYICYQPWRPVNEII